MMLKESLDYLTMQKKSFDNNFDNITFQEIKQNLFLKKKISSSIHTKCYQNVTYLILNLL